MEAGGNGEQGAPMRKKKNQMMARARARLDKQGGCLGVG